MPHMARARALAVRWPSNSRLAYNAARLIEQISPHVAQPHPSLHGRGHTKPTNIRAAYKRIHASTANNKAKVYVKRVRDECDLDEERRTPQRIRNFASRRGQRYILMRRCRARRVADTGGTQIRAPHFVWRCTCACALLSSHTAPVTTANAERDDRPRDGLQARVRPRKRSDVQ